MSTTKAENNVNQFHNSRTDFFFFFLNLQLSWGWNLENMNVPEVPPSFSTSFSFHRIKQGAHASAIQVCTARINYENKLI